LRSNALLGIQVQAQGGVDMADIPQKLFFRIGEVCDLIQVQPHVLRYWETEFPTLTPQKNRAGQRVYRRKDVEMVMRIRDLLYVEKFTIAGARKRLLEEAKKGIAPKVKTVAREKPLTPEKTVAQEFEQEFASDLELDALADEVDDFDAGPEPAQTTGNTEGAASTTPSSVSASITQALANQPPQQELSPRTQRALRVLKHELEGLLTLLNSDATLNRSV
jgi:DNA-binding transcriptional MerR regulator